MSSTATASSFDSWTAFLSNVVQSHVSSGAHCPDCGEPVSSIDLICPLGHALREPPAILVETRLWVISGARTLAGIVALSLAFDLAWPAYIFGSLLSVTFFAMILRQHHRSQIWFLSHALIVAIVVACLVFPDYGNDARDIRLAILIGLAATMGLGSLLFTWLDRASDSWYTRGLAVNALVLLLLVAVTAVGLVVEVTTTSSIPWHLILWAMVSALVGLLGGVALVGIASIGKIQAREYRNIWADNPGRGQRAYPALQSPTEPTPRLARLPSGGIWNQIACQVDKIRVTVITFFLRFMYQTQLVVARGITLALKQLCKSIDYTFGVIFRFIDRLRRSAIMAYRTGITTLRMSGTSSTRFTRLVLVPVALLSCMFALLAVASLSLLEYVRTDDWSLGLGGLKAGFELDLLEWGPVLILSVGGAILFGCAAIGCLLRANPFDVVLSAISGATHYMTESYLVFLVISYALWIGGIFVPASPFAFGPAMLLATSLLAYLLIRHGGGEPSAESLISQTRT